MEMAKEQLLNEAREHLRKNPFDEVHGEKHHDLVWENCQKIIEEEKLKVDEEALQVAAMWHDVERGKDNETRLLNISLAKYGTPEVFRDTVLEIINTHSFGNSQESVEAKILFDADKLEYVNSDRVRILLEEYEKGKIKKERFDYYVEAWRNRIKGVRKQFHFNYSRELFEERLVEFIEYTSTSSDLAKFSKDFVI